MKKPEWIILKICFMTLKIVIHKYTWTPMHPINPLTEHNLKKKPSILQYHV